MKYNIKSSLVIVTLFFSGCSAFNLSDTLVEKGGINRATAHSDVSVVSCDSSYTNDILIYSPPPINNELDDRGQPPNRVIAKNCGVWESVIPNQSGAAIHNILGMQTVHSVLLPSGKILMTSGSSWRNKSDVDFYPSSPNPVPGTGLFNVLDDPFSNDKLDDYYELVNNTAIYNPEDNSFYRIHHPRPEPDPKSDVHFKPNDQFCSGHLHMPDGNVLFAGGTEYYYPFRTGNQSTFVFDWRKELSVDWETVDWQSLPNTNDPNYLWSFSGFMERGRWYPSLVPLNDGRFALFSGFVNYLNPVTQEPMYQFEINHSIDFFDPSQLAAGSLQDAWKSIDVKNKKNSPFNTRIYKAFKPTECVDMEHFEQLRISGSPNAKGKLPPPCDCGERCRQDNQFDAFKLYPNNYQTENNKIFLSREGDWVSLRTADTAYMRRTKNTYWIDIKGTSTEPDVSFTRGPDRLEDITSYGTSFFDPNTNSISILGGQPTSAGTSTDFIPAGDDRYNPRYTFDSKPNSSEDLIATRFLGGLGSSKLETFHLDNGVVEGGRWNIESHYLGKAAQDNRTMGAAIVLPTRQVLLINGGNYDFYGPVLYPTLLTPEFSSDGTFKRYHKKRLTDATEPRLYHNTAMLLPSGKVWVSGGNNARAAVGLSSKSKATEKTRLGHLSESKGQAKPDLSLVDTDLYFFQDGQMAKTQKGMLSTPTENWTAEIFSPPYLYIGGDYRPTIKRIRQPNPTPGVTLKSRIEGKDYYLLKSHQQYLVELGDIRSGDKNAELIFIKLPSFTHNWDQGHKFISIPFQETACADKACTLSLRTPDFEQSNIPPGFYMMFFVDKNGKPSQATMVRLDDSAIAP